MKEVIPTGLSCEKKNDISESNEFGEMRLKKRGQLKHKWLIHKNPKVIRYRQIQLQKSEAVVPKQSEESVFDGVGFFSKFSSSLMPCARTMVARSR